MEFLSRKKLYSDSTLKSLHNDYLNCISNTIQKAFETQVAPTSEFCLHEKKLYYNHLNDNSKIEHDNILRYFNTIRTLN
jgi:hypothetical protein